MEYVGYVRVSTVGQAVEGVSLDAQEAQIRRWGEQHDGKLLAVYHDDGISGCKLRNRPGAQAAIALACERGVPLVVYSLSRLFRSTREALEVSDDLHKAGADIVSLSEHLDTTTAVGKMVFRLLAVLAEFERDLVSERTKMALARVRSTRVRVTGVPYGWRTKGKGQLVPVPQEQEILALIVDWRDAGNSYRWIAEELERRDVPTRSGKTWRASTVRGILRRIEDVLGD